MSTYYAAITTTLLSCKFRNLKYNLMIAPTLKLYIFHAADATLHILAYALTSAMATYNRLCGNIRAHCIELVKEF